MPNTYTQLYVQVVFAVKFRQALISPDWDERLRHYITAIIQNAGNKVLAINNMPDHIHIFFGLHPEQSISKLMQHVKADSTKWINANKLTSQKFAWQNGYGAFTYTRSHIDGVVKYILNQQKHHEKKDFLKEYKMMLDKRKIDYEEKYLFISPE